MLDRNREKIVWIFFKLFVHKLNYNHVWIVELSQQVEGIHLNWWSECLRVCLFDEQVNHLQKYFYKYLHGRKSDKEDEDSYFGFH